MAGNRTDISWVETAARAEGLTTVRLPVASAFHSPIVASSSAPLTEYLTSLALGAAAFPVYANATAQPYGQSVADQLGDQVRQPVRFREMIVFFSSRRRHTRCGRDWSSDVCSSDLTIYFETAFLHKSNEKIKEDIETLFREYTKPINYYVPLEDCRSNDDWEAVRKKINGYMQKLNGSSGVEQTKMHINIEFPIDRLMQFITQYNNFIDQGGKFYEKFKIILNSYENEEQCQTQLPLEYQKLKSDIDVAINKFNVAYKPVEINGSKMKEILYGINEYE